MKFVNFVTFAEFVNFVRSSANAMHHTISQSEIIHMNAEMQCQADFYSLRNQRTIGYVYNASNSSLKSSNMMTLNKPFHLVRNFRDV